MMFQIRRVRDDAARGRRDGFPGMMAIHPTQVPIINEAFRPTEDTFAWAQKIIWAFKQNPDAGTLAIDGRLVDRPHLAQARRLWAHRDRTSGADQALLTVGRDRPATRARQAGSSNRQPVRAESAARSSAVSMSVR